MVQFRALSHKFDEENALGPMKVDRVKVIKQRYDSQLKKLRNLGVDMPKSEAMELELADLLHKTSNMTRDKA